jgi:transposase
MKQLTQNMVIERQGKRGRYRRWPEAQKQQIVEETYEPGVSVSIVARRHDVNANQVFRWRQLYGASLRNKAVSCEFIPLGIVSPEPTAKRQTSGMMTIDLGNRMCVTVDHDVDEGALGRVLAAVRGLP